MAKSLAEYAAWLDERQLLWPTAPVAVPAKATPALQPLPGVRAVLWDLYGTLLLIAGGRLLLQHPQQIRMQIALEKTIHEFNMWQSMSRKPGAPWEYMLQQYNRLVEDRALTTAVRKGESPEVNAAEIWQTLVERLGKKEYNWDAGLYGDLEAYSEKIAFFFHASLQGVGAAPNALTALQSVREAGLLQGIVGDGQPFSLVQLERSVAVPGATLDGGPALWSDAVVLSYDCGVRQPSQVLFETALERLARKGVGPSQVLYVASRLRKNIGPAKTAGLRTALFAGDKNSLEATSEEIRDPDLRPDRILTDLAQIRQILKR